jgi:hypothetical protein
LNVGAAVVPAQVVPELLRGRVAALLQGDPA